MESNIVERLFQSFVDLESAIDSAKNTLKNKESVPREIVERLNSYDGILLKQRTLAHELSDLMKLGKWDEVSRHVSLINGLSAMIRDDAKAILSALSASPDVEDTDDDITYC